MKRRVTSYLIGAMFLTGCGCDPSLDVTGVSETESTPVNAPHNNGTVVVGDGNTVNNYIDGKLVDASALEYVPIPNMMATSKQSGKYSPTMFKIELIGNYLYITNPTDEYLSITGSFRGNTPSNYDIFVAPHQVGQENLWSSTIPDNGCIIITSMLFDTSTSYKGALGTWTGSMTVCKSK